MTGSITHKAVRRRALGQHYLIDESVIESIIGASGIRKEDRVLEIGTGKGALTARLARLSPHLEAFELDRKNFTATSEQGIADLKLHLGDGFAAKHDFDVLVSSLPYSESSNFIEWLSQSEYDRAVVVLQRDFVDKLLSAPGMRSYRALSAISQMSSTIEVIRNVGRESFDPPPKVLSVVVLIRPRAMLSQSQIRFVKLLFSQRRKKLSAALRKLRVKSEPTEAGLLERRVEDLSTLDLENLLRSRGEPVNPI